MGKVKKKIRPGLIEASKEDVSVLVHYEVEELELHDDGTSTSLSKGQDVKRVKVKSLSEKSNIPLLAKEIQEACKLIHPSKQGQVEKCLYELQERIAGQSEEQHAAPTDAKSTPSKAPKDSVVLARRTSRATEDREQRQHQHAEVTRIMQTQMKRYEPAFIEQLETYIEDLYEEDMKKKVTATGMIAHLFRNTKNFETLLEHGTLFQTLARVLREDGKKSIDICINIVSAFFSISNFSQFHHLIMEQQVGAMTVDLIALEIKRTEIRSEEKGISPAVVAQKVMEASTGMVQLSDEERRLLGVIQKQDRLLYLCFYMLLNLAEDVHIEKKMKKKNLVVYLVKMLDRSNVELLILAVTFLKKLSIYRENKQKMLECGIIPKLCGFVPVQNDVLLMAVLRLLHNLSFDAALRDQMVQGGIIPRAVPLMRDGRFQPVVMGLLYHVSMEDRYKTMFPYTEAISIIFEMLMRVEDLRSTPELIALAVNLTQHPRNAEPLCEGERLDLLIKRALTTCDELAFKVLRNVSQAESPGIKKRFMEYFEQMVVLLKQPGMTAELFVEVLGTLANLHVPDYDFVGMASKHDLFNFLSQYAQPGAVDDDILLEVVMFVGVLCCDSTAPLLLEAGLVSSLFTMMGDKKEDDEFVLQIAFTFQKLLMYPSTRTELLNNTQVVYYLVDLLLDKNKNVRKIADKALDVIMDTEPEWAVQVRSLKFQAYNQEWLDALEHPAGSESQPHGGLPAQYEDEDEVDFDGALDVMPGVTYALGDAQIMDLDQYKALGWGTGDMSGYADDEPPLQPYEELGAH